MANLTLANKADHYNSLLASTVLNKLKLDKVEKFKSHKEADTLFEALVVTIGKQGAEVKTDDNGLPLIVPPKAEEKKPKKAAKKVEINADEETVTLVKSIIEASTAEGQEWYNTGIWIYNRKALFGTAAKENRKIAYKELDNNSGGAVPEKGISNDGKEITLRKQNGSVKWAAWDKTRRWTQYLARIFQAIEQSGWELVFPDGQLVNKDEIKKLAQKQGPGESPIDTVRRNIDMALKKIEECEKKDLSTLKSLVMDLNAAYADFEKNNK